MIKRQAAFEGGGKLLKGALHVHTTRSDGKVSPEETLKAFEACGYQFVALTDHRYYNYASYGDCSVTIVPGMEMDRRFLGTTGNGVHCFHTVCLGPVSGNGYRQDERFPTGEVADQEEFQRLLDDIHANNNLTIYCHPGWSATPVHEYEFLRGNFAMELWNTGCAYENDMDRDNGAHWDYLLMNGQKLFGVATDDCHHAKHIGKGYVMVNAKNDVDSILCALKNGRFYSSCGPVIKDFYVEDGVAHVACSLADRVGFCFGRAPTRYVFSGDQALTEAAFELKPYYTYIRATVVDKDGNRAWTNPIFLENN